MLTFENCETIKQNFVFVITLILSADYCDALDTHRSETVWDYSNTMRLCWLIPQILWQYFHCGEVYL